MYNAEIQIRPGDRAHALRVVALAEELRWTWNVYAWDCDKAIRAARKKLKENGFKNVPVKRLANLED